MTSQEIQHAKIGDRVQYSDRVWTINAIRPGAALGMTVPELHLVPLKARAGDPAELSVWLSATNPGLSKEE